ncbi:MAG: hypothetical protein GXP53_12930, partial [Deltaproteobacteria bacterium]|nr:hypothetical protein [Deltaproteobacteria bacterium]
MNDAEILPGKTGITKGRFYEKSLYSYFDRLVSDRIIPEEKLEKILSDASSAGVYPEELLIKAGVPKHDILRCLSLCHNLPIVEFDEGIHIRDDLAECPDVDTLKKKMWIPVAVKGNSADIIMADP